MNRQFGRYFVPDSRDHAFRMTAPVKTTKRAKTWRLGKLTDQKTTPQCVGYAWFNWFLARPIHQHPIQPQGIYHLAQLLDEWEGTDYDGTSVRAAAKVLELTGHVSEYQWAWDVDPVADHVLEVGPVVLGTRWYEGMMVPDAQGRVHISGRNHGGHATLLYGIDLRKGIAKIRNSWGDWGLKGSCIISLEDLERLLHEDGECCTAIETKVRG